jgi:hypothetical protein
VRDNSLLPNGSRYKKWNSSEEEPLSAAGTRLPVFVYVYGGGSNEGSIAVSIYDGAALANKGRSFMVFGETTGERVR